MEKKMKFTRALALLLVGMFMLVGCGSTKKYNAPAEWVAESMKGPNNLPLAEKAGDWSTYKTFNLAKGGTVQVSSQFVKHHGSTCHYNVWYKNIGTTPVDAISGLTSHERSNVYSHNSGHIILKPDQEVTFNDLEARECPIRFGTHTEMDDCAACQAWVVFAQ